MEENYFLDGEFDVEELDIEELAHKDWDQSYQEVSWEEHIVTGRCSNLQVIRESNKKIK